MQDNTTNQELIYLKLNPEDQELFEKANLTVGHAETLLKVHSQKNRSLVLDYVVRKKLSEEQTRQLYEKLFYPKSKQRKKERLPNDVRLYVNTINNTINRMKNAGIDAVAQKRETDEYIECIIRIPKTQT